MTTTYFPTVVRQGSTQNPYQPFQQSVVAPPLTTSGGGGRRKSAPPPTSPGSVSTAAPDATLQAALAKLNAATDQQQANVNKPLTAQTDQLVNQSDLAIGSRAAGAQQGLQETLAARGLGSSSTLQGQLAGQMSEAAQREQARAGTDIRLSQAKRQDDLDLARQGMANNLLTAGVNASAMPAQLSLAQMGFGLQQQSLAQQGQNMSLQAQLERERMAQQERQAQADLALRQQQMIQQRSPYVSTPPRPSGGAGMMPRGGW